MKKLLIIPILCLLSFTSDEPKKLNIELTEQEWFLVMQVIDQSNAHHVQVKAVQEALSKQLIPQVENNP